MIAALAKLIEWGSVQATFRRMPHPEGRLQLDEAIQFLNGPDFMPVESQPAQLVFDDASRFDFSPQRRVRTQLRCWLMAQPARKKCSRSARALFAIAQSILKCFAFRCEHEPETAFSLLQSITNKTTKLRLN